ncbi:hypothetical protein RLOC_00007205 [Lonchura striata]|uniref:Uncharacterized protein n=1 Tax=Lonchura striata TaxID=40157 RepID=A0A218V7H9_9PASE|nr:hypothetical protein RLOC_00007205 [Lonchura striata domestica]
MLLTVGRKTHLHADNTLKDGCSMKSTILGMCAINVKTLQEHDIVSIGVAGKIHIDSAVHRAALLTQAKFNDIPINHQVQAL